MLAPQPQHALEGARILLGASLLGAYGVRAGAALDHFGPGGFGGHDFYARLPDAPPLAPGPAEIFRVLVGVGSETAILALYGLLLLASLAYTLGVRARLAGAVALLLHVLFWTRNPFAYNGAWAEFLVAPMLYTLAAPIGRHWSVEAWWRRRQGAAPASWTGPGWPLRLLQINACTLYLAAGASRLDKASWLNGEMVFVVLSGATHSRWVLDWSPWMPLLKLATWAALLLEALAPVVLWLGPLGRAWALALVGLHLGLEATMNIGMWSPVAIACLLSFLLPWRRGPARGGGS
jgi:hypothetical protein